MDQIGCQNTVLSFIEDDLMHCIKFSKPGISELYGSILQWLAAECHAIVMHRKKELPARVKCFTYPQLFCIALPYHQNFQSAV